MLSRAAVTLNGLVNRQVSLRGREQQELGGRRCKLPLYPFFLTLFVVKERCPVVLDVLLLIVTGM